MFVTTMHGKNALTHSLVSAFIFPGYRVCRGYGLQIEIVDSAMIQTQELKDVGDGALFLSPDFFTLGLVSTLAS